MLSILKATALLGSSSFVTLLIGLVSVKAWALLVGPTGLGQQGLLQSLIGYCGLLAGLGIGTGLVRHGARQIAENNPRQIAAFRVAAWCLFWLLGALACLLLAVFQMPISRFALGGAEHSDLIPIAGLTLLFTLAGGLQASVLNAHHQIGALARLSVIGAAVGAVQTIILLWLFGMAAVGPTLLVGAMCHWAIATWQVRRHSPQPTERPTPAEVLAAARELVRFGVPYTGSALVGTHFLVPLLVLHQFSIVHVGFQRAAATISERYLGILLTSMGQDYYPRLSATDRTAPGLGAMINQQARLALLLGAPLVFTLIALAPVLVPLIYSPDFLPVVGIIEWQMVGNLFRFTSWALAFPILVYGSGRLYFLTELAGSVVTLGANWAAMRLWGLPGLGIAFLVAFIVYFFLVNAILRRLLGVSLSPDNQVLLAGAAGLATFLVLMPSLGLSAIQFPVAIASAIAATALSAALIVKEIQGARHAPST